MDPFSQHSDAARLLATAASALRHSTQKVRLARRNKTRSPKAVVLGKTLLDLTRTAIQLVAAAYEVCERLETKPPRPRKKPSIRRRLQSARGRLTR